jgi:hypothetical protein
MTAGAYVLLGACNWSYTPVWETSCIWQLHMHGADFSWCSIPATQNHRRHGLGLPSQFFTVIMQHQPTTSMCYPLAGRAAQHTCAACKSQTVLPSSMRAVGYVEHFDIWHCLTLAAEWRSASAKETTPWSGRRGAVRREESQTATDSSS